MAGIYIHIPYCRKKCSYCDFYKSIKQDTKKDLLKFMLNEISLKKDYLNDETIETIYIGGGTPSVLEIDEINLIFSRIFALYHIVKHPEITFEANPDDLNTEYLKALCNNTVVNRLSIGIQSFIDRDLRLLNRRHDSGKAREVLDNACSAGFTNISADLIYAIPGMTSDEWEYNLKVILSSNIQHLSAYDLTFEPGTLIYQKLIKKEIESVTEDNSIEQFKILVKMAEQADFEQYELSNFSIKGHQSLHNSNYWRGKKYLGIGPSAHSYNLESRQWNVADNVEYMRRMNHNEPYFEIEYLSKEMKFNEFIMTGLRTMRGIYSADIESDFGAAYLELFKKNVHQFIRTGTMSEIDNRFFLTENGKLIADYIISELFLDSEEYKRYKLL